MVHIRKLEIFGFKSFGYKNTLVNFEQGLVAISGANGSGKSNILDAISFSLGENSPKVMRVDKLRSLLHDVDNAKHGAKIARVSCHFDNSDRKIPVDSNTVTITREMDENGENIYYLNQKKVLRNHVLDILEVANCGIHKLNIVQQGTITRISEFNAEERRKIIEDIIGLAYFDEKKVESLKQLDEADRRLEIALARMDEIKKRIDELELERNNQLRFDILDRELKRFYAIQSSNKLRDIESNKISKERNLNAIQSESKKFDEQRGQIRDEIKKLEEEKQKFMDEVNVYNQTKATIDSEIAAAMHQFESANSKLATNARRLSQIDSRLPEIQSDLATLNEKRSLLENQIAELKNSIGIINETRKSTNADLASVDSEISQVLKQQSQIATNKLRVDETVQKLTDQLNETKLALSKFEQERVDIQNKMEQNSLKIKSILDEKEYLLDLERRLRRVRSGHESMINDLKSRLGNLRERRVKIEKDIEETAIIFEKASKAAAQYEAKIKVVKEVMHEDYSIAKLKEDSRRLGIQGLVFEILTWDKQYERPLLAVGSDWLKGLVVNDFATLLGLAEFAQEKKLPKIRIIPLDAISDTRISINKEGGVLGVLSEFVQCNEKFESLKNFIFGNIVLVDSKNKAYELSKKGYRAVTIDGQFFEADANAVVVDVNSKVSHLTKIILLSTSVDGLVQSLELLRKFIQNKKGQLKKLERIADSLENRYNSSETGLANVSLDLTNIKAKLKNLGMSEDQLTSRISQLRKREESVLLNMSKLQSYESSLDERISLTRENYADEGQARVASLLSSLNEKRTSLLSSHSTISTQFRELTGNLTNLGNEENSFKANVRLLSQEQSSLNHEKYDIEVQSRTLVKEKENAEAVLVTLREKEQQLISTSGTSVSTLKEYDSNLKGLYESERTLSKEVNSLERQSDSISRDVRDLMENEERIRKTLQSYGYSTLLESFDVDKIIVELESEKRSLSGSLNTRAPDAYVEISNGYRSMSSRKNELEEERNSIVKFIEEIDKGKRQTFLESYDKVDKDIREIFSKMTGGNAWLEIQNEDDIFSSGISYLVQFPNKPKRESTSISGGEKTLAAITFLLALQKLKPSPFYLLDEVDAHLDALNTERLATILEDRAKGSQMIMVSLKDSVVKKATLIYGVFPRNGVSHVVSHRISNISEVAN
ncbi:chromosome segregation SMC family protein [Candidatus Nitrosotalea okcheonensis]|uniref:Putative SMC domain protein n=1 Tax=Candidatus Nitrosotalea okcheonensis TaxID=1903276 RepID=A0A2H1FD17_9ARCH|nr:chromosome segregation SMC family protein [Candidatus Nitrosotalea okcheonensis]SMH70655.1 putative SMC domain protein [Candidatus Nitrosotalea okcheonensis]